MKNRKQIKLEKLLAECEMLAREVAGDACTQPEEAYAQVLKHFPGISRARKENFLLIGLNGRRQVIFTETISVGTLTATLVHPREVFKRAIIESCSSVVIAHNHPSGDPTPSHEDRLLTERMSQAGRLLGINLDDHLVIGKGCFVSLRRLGLLVA